MHLKHIYWFAYYNEDEPSVRYRCIYPLRYLAETHDITYSIVHPGYDRKHIAAFIRIYLSALIFRKKNSLIVFQKIFTGGIYAHALKLLLFFRPTFTLYDTDDAEHTRRTTDTIHHFIKHCSACSAGSRSLIQYISPLNPNAFLLTSPVIDHGVIKRERENIFTIGWIGYYGAHLESLETLLFPALTQIPFPVRFIVLGARNEGEAEHIISSFKKYDHISVEAPLNISWLDERSVYHQIARFDVGVSPLLDTEFNRGKSAFKLKQCLSCGIPVLGSSVGENKYFLQEGVNGYFCDSPKEYLERIIAIRNAPLSDYMTMSKEAAASSRLFSMEHFSASLLAITENLPIDHPLNQTL